MEIKLNEKQLQVLGGIQAEKQQLQAEFAKVTKRETEALILICDAVGADVAPGSQLEIKEGGILVVPDKPAKDGKVKKLKE